MQQGGCLTIEIVRQPPCLEREKSIDVLALQSNEASLLCSQVIFYYCQLYRIAIKQNQKLTPIPIIKLDNGFSLYSALHKVL